MTTTVALSIAIRDALTRDLSASTNSLNKVASYSMADGTATGQANRFYEAQGDLQGAVTPEHVDFGLSDMLGGKDDFGRTYALTKVCGVYVFNCTANPLAEPLSLGGIADGTDWIDHFTDTAGAKIYVHPGACWFWSSTIATMTTFAPLGDPGILRISNEDGELTSSYELFIIGSQ